MTEQHREIEAPGYMRERLDIASYLRRIGVTLDTTSAALLATVASVIETGRYRDV